MLRKYVCMELCDLLPLTLIILFQLNRLKMIISCVYIDCVALCVLCTVLCCLVCVVTKRQNVVCLCNKMTFVRLIVPLFPLSLFPHLRTIAFFPQCWDHWIGRSRITNQKIQHQIVGIAQSSSCLFFIIIMINLSAIQTCTRILGTCEMLFSI